MAEKKRTLAETCAPFFLYLATFRRNAETSDLGVETLHEALQGGIDFVGTQCERDPRLSKMFERVWYALVVTADQVVLASSWPHRAGWSMKLLESHYFKTFEGGKRFFQLVAEVLEDTGADAPELAEVLFTCMALGFQGELIGERKELERRRRQLFEKARLPGALGSVLTPEAYGRNSPQNTLKLPAVGILSIVVVALGAVLFSLLAGDVVTRWKNSALTRSIDRVIEELEGEER